MPAPTRSRRSSPSAIEIGGALVGDADAPLLRAAFEQRPAAGELRDDVGDMVGSRQAQGPQADRRAHRPRGQRHGAVNRRRSVTRPRHAAGLSASRFQHLFTREVGVPFRRYRVWHRLRAAIREAAQGSNLTTAAHAAGFADQAHFTREFRRTFGAPPSRGL